MPDTPEAPPRQVPLDVPLVGGGEPAAPVGAQPLMMDPGYTEDLYANLSMLQQQVQQLGAANEAMRVQMVTLQTQDLRNREQIVALQQREAQLQEQLANKRSTQSREPDDFASAVSHSLDTLQARLTGLTNSMSDFAVREFAIDAKVAVNVTPLGTVEYRFIQPGESVDPSAVSNISMKVVPVPKQTQAGAWSPVEHTPAAGVEEIRGIGKQLREQLRERGIYTVGDLLHAGGRVRGSVELASMLQVDRYRVDEWLAHAQLLTIRDVTGRIAGVLYEIGVRSLRDLAGREPAALALEFNAQVQRTGRRRVAHVTAAVVTPWVRAARNYLGQAEAAAAAPPASPTRPAPTAPAGSGTTAPSGSTPAPSGPTAPAPPAPTPAPSDSTTPAPPEPTVSDGTGTTTPEPETTPDTLPSYEEM